MSQVRGVLFGDYVRMLRMRKDIDWSQHLLPEDLALMRERIAPDSWYPMATFERLGNVIFEHVANSQLGLARLWGHTSVTQLVEDMPVVLAAGDPFETVNRVRGLRATWFDFDALIIPQLLDDECELSIAYGMGAMAEEAATWQTIGCFERLLEIAGGTDVKPTFLTKSWKGTDPRSRVNLRWTPP